MKATLRRTSRLAAMISSGILLLSLGGCLVDLAAQIALNKALAPLRGPLYVIFMNLLDI